MDQKYDLSNFRFMLFHLYIKRYIKVPDVSLSDEILSVKLCSVKCNGTHIIQTLPKNCCGMHVSVVVRSKIFWVQTMWSLLLFESVTSVSQISPEFKIYHFLQYVFTSYVLQQEFLNFVPTWILLCNECPDEFTSCNKRGKAPYFLSQRKIKEETIVSYWIQHKNFSHILWEIFYCSACFCLILPWCDFTLRWGLGRV